MEGRVSKGAQTLDVLALPKKHCRNVCERENLRTRRTESAAGRLLRALIDEENGFEKLGMALG